MFVLCQERTVIVICEYPWHHVRRHKPAERLSTEQLYVCNKLGNKMMCVVNRCEGRWSFDLSSYHMQKLFLCHRCYPNKITSSETCNGPVIADLLVVLWLVSYISCVGILEVFLLIDVPLPCIENDGVRMEDSIWRLMDTMVVLAQCYMCHVIIVTIVS